MLTLKPSRRLYENRYNDAPTVNYQPRFVDVALARWEKLTGKKAEAEVTNCPRVS